MYLLSESVRFMTLSQGLEIIIIIIKLLLPVVPGYCKYVIVLINNGYKTA